MYKYILLAGSMLIAAPVLAQTAPIGEKTVSKSPSTTMSAPVTSPQSDPAAPQPADPAQPIASDQPVAPAAGAPASAAMPSGQPAVPSAAPAAQIADIVNKEFPVYDKDGNGSLSKSEFSTWMLALKKTSTPGAKDDAANKAWSAQAFAQADANKSNSLSKDELIKFLSLGQKAS